MRVEAVHERAVKVEDGRARRMEGHSANLPRTHGYDPDMRTTSNARAALLLAALAVVSALPGCKPMNPRPAVAPPPQEADAPQTANRDPSKDPAPGDPEWKSSSALGKSRDAAVRTKAAVDAYQQEVARQADDVFKNR